MSALHAPLAPATATGGRLITPDGRALPFEGGALSVDCAGGLARVVLRQRFTNPHAEPLRVTYQVPLPSDAAVSGFAFELDGARIVGEVDRKAAARERFEEALIEGRTAALLEQDRSSLFTQQVGNLPPGATVTCELVLDQVLSWHGATGGWEWRFPTVVAPRFLGASGQTPDAGRVTVDVAEAGTPARVTLAITVRDALTGDAVSPSHPLHAVSMADHLELGLADEAGAALNRDVVVRWPVAALCAGVALEAARSSTDRPTAAQTAGLITLVPPTTPATPVARDLIVLLDTSGSMGGRPLAQAQAVTCALIDSLTDADQLQLVEFSTRPRAWKRGPVAATAGTKAAATAWVQGLRAGGGTQMKDGILAALARIRGEAQRQVVLVTDGLIGFERDIVREVLLRLPRGCRVHTLGIGSGVNRSLLTPVARAGGGVELIVDLDEDPAAAARSMVAATAAPQVVDLEVTGDALLSVAAHRPPDLLAGRPVRLALALKPEGGTLHVSGHTAEGPWQTTLTVPAIATGAGSPAVVTLLGREQVAELELRAAAGESVDADIERVGLDFQIATRRTSWVAIHHAQTVDPTAPTRAERVAQALPHGMSAEGLGLRPAMATPKSMSMSMPAPRGGARPARTSKRARRIAPSFGDGAGAPPPEADRAEGAPKAKNSLLVRAMNVFSRAPEPPAEAAPMAPPSSAPMDIGHEVEDQEFDAAPAMDLQMAPREADSDDPTAPQTLAARVRLAKGDRLVLEVLLDAAFDWPSLGDRVVVVLQDGRRLSVTLDRTATTAPGRVAAGGTLRVTLRGPQLGSFAAILAAVELASEDATPDVTLTLSATR